mmetsp:Transcript_690/g.2597  ORF Transcript_690/g.2597 Transcript_690/m.2597 type:complete len:234 (+) Transcript_690:1745-2446(+)
MSLPASVALAFSACCALTASSFAFLSCAVSFCASALSLFSMAIISECFSLSAASSPSPATSATSEAASTTTTPSLIVAVISMRAARDANSSVLTVSSDDSAEGEQHTSRLVLQLPPTESSRILVSFESLYGMNFFFSASAWTMFPKERRLELMFVASLSCVPVTPLFLIRSEPARSTTVSFPNVAFISTLPPLVPVLSSALGRFETLIWKTACERLEDLFIFVSAYTRFIRPF